LAEVSQTVGANPRLFLCLEVPPSHFLPHFGSSRFGHRAKRDLPLNPTTLASLLGAKRERCPRSVLLQAQHEDLGHRSFGNAETVFSFPRFFESFSSKTPTRQATKTPTPPNITPKWRQNESNGPQSSTTPFLFNHFGSIK